MDLTALSGVDLMTAFQTPQVASKLTDKSDSMLVESEQQGTVSVCTESYRRNQCIQQCCGGRGN